MEERYSAEKFHSYSESSAKQSSQAAGDMAVAFRDSWFDRELFPRHRDSTWARDDWLDTMHDWPTDWPRPRDVFGRFIRDTERWWHDWPTSWPRMDAVMPRFTSHLDRLDSNWRMDPFWKDLYPQWAEPVFKEGIDVNSSIVNDERRFAVSIDAYQFRPEEIQVKTLDDTLLIEGRHEEVRDNDNYTKMYFVRKYQLPADVNATDISSSIDAKGRLTVEANKRAQALTGRERLIPIEGSSKSPRATSQQSRTRFDSGFSSNGLRTDNFSSPAHRSYSPVQVDTHSNGQAGRNIRIEREGARSEFRSESRGDSRDYRDAARSEVRDYRDVPRTDYRADSRGGFRGAENVLRREQELGEGRQGGYSSSESYYREARGGGLSPHQVTSGNENRAYANGSGNRRASFETNGFRSHSRGAESRGESRQQESYQSSGYQGGFQRESESRNAATSRVQFLDSRSEQDLGVLPHWSPRHPLQ